MNNEYVVSDPVEIGAANESILIDPTKDGWIFEEAGCLQHAVED